MKITIKGRLTAIIKINYQDKKLTILEITTKDETLPVKVHEEFSTLLKNVKQGDQVTVNAHLGGILTQTRAGIIRNPRIFLREIYKN